MSDSASKEVITDWLDNERVLALALAIEFLNGVARNPGATPAGIDKLFKNADQIIEYLNRR